MTMYSWVVVVSHVLNMRVYTKKHYNTLLSSSSFELYIFNMVQYSFPECVCSINTRCLETDGQTDGKRP